MSCSVSPAIIQDPDRGIAAVELQLHQIEAGLASRHLSGMIRQVSAVVGGRLLINRGSSLNRHVKERLINPTRCRTDKQSKELKTI
jgi:hypothetical protein